jgi:ABC-2 type transport system permease protein
VSASVESVGGRPSASRSGGLTQTLRILRVIAGAEFKLKYSDSMLGYVWSLLKPLGLFSMLYIVFGRFFKLNVGIEHYPLYLLIGIVLWTYFADAVGLTMTSIVHRGAVLSRLSFPRLVIPVSVTLTSGITFCVNLTAIAAFVAWNQIVPRPEWLLLLPLLLELYVFTLGLSLILATVFVRLRDVAQVWELAAQLLFYASPIIYPVSFLPPWFKPLAFLNPFVQVMQDARAILLPGSDPVTVQEILGAPFGRLVPIGIAIAFLVAGLAYFRRESPWFAERL